METNNRRVPPEKRKRTETSCDKCKTRKQKCDRLLGHPQCRYCELHKLPCSTTQPRKKRIYGSVEGLGGRLTLLESLVKGLVPEADLSSIEEMQQLGKSLGIPLPVIEDPPSNELEKPGNPQEDESTLPLMPDQQGQVQYIGPASSFSFHLNLRRLIGNYSALEFAMFGRNAADEIPGISNSSLTNEGREQNEKLVSDNTPSDCSSPSDVVREIDGPILDSLIDAYFEVIHPDFCVLHEASFREQYESWTASSLPTDPAWLCGLLCVLILARRVALITIPEEAERKWWKHAQTLLPTVFFTSNMFTVQALMLAALHLHNTNHRDACWNLTGTAIRIAVAIGLHRDDIKHIQNPLGRELRKQLWWTLYTFEQMQVSSYDRPSAIAHNVAAVSCPNERIVGVAGHCPQDLMKWSNKLVVLLSSACRVLNPARAGASFTDDTYSKPLSPAAGILRDLERWKEALPLHLRLDVLDSLAPFSQRPLLLMHAQFYYAVVLSSRLALLRRATIMSKTVDGSSSHILLTVSESCIDSGRQLGRLMLKLESINKFNALTWWDIFYTFTASLVLVLDIICQVKQHGPHSAMESQNILRKLGALSTRQCRDPRMPGTMQKWAVIVIDVSAMADQFTSTQPNSGSAPIQTPRLAPIRALLPSSDSSSMSRPLTPIAGCQLPAPQPSPSLPNTILTEVIPFDDTNMTDENIPQFWAQISFMDDSNGQLQDWRWDDIGAILRGDT
ncbi:fungal-specific transcription factor domain-containing protein [Tricladium varicosporioides]|nr:fungal-specific transcription factor domain-containing protein [Hymenoscyphus varicosporioides]